MYMLLNIVICGHLNLFTYSIKMQINEKKRMKKIKVSLGRGGETNVSDAPPSLVRHLCSTTLAWDLAGPSKLSKLPNDNTTKYIWVRNRLRSTTIILRAVSRVNIRLVSEQKIKIFKNPTSLYRYNNQTIGIRSIKGYMQIFTTTYLLKQIRNNSFKVQKKIFIFILVRHFGQPSVFYFLKI